MKKLVILSLAVLLITSCKKKVEFEPEGPTDVRFKNITTLNFTDVIVKTSEYEEDSDTIPVLNAGQTSSYTRFKKAYTKVQITAKINTGGSLQTFSLQTPFTYLTYIGQDMVTFEIYIKNEAARELDVNILLDGPITLK